MLKNVNELALTQKKLEKITVEIIPIIFKENSERVKKISDCSKLTVEVDEMQSFIKKKQNTRWLWHAIDHRTGKVLAFVLGTRTDEMFLELKNLLKPFGITKFYTDGLKTYERHIRPEERLVSKYKMQKIERKHLTLRTRIKRLARKTICFSKSVEMHDTVIGLFINKYEFGINI